jgi:hypothetical protein
MAGYGSDLLKSLGPVQKQLKKSGKVLTKPDVGRFFSWTFRMALKLTILTIKACYYSAKKFAGRYP